MITNKESLSMFATHKHFCLLMLVLSCITISTNPVHSLPVQDAPKSWLKAHQTLLSKREFKHEIRSLHVSAQGQPKYLNRLILETSPYLLQHAYNPVNWYPWSEQAFKKAVEENKPILLSIGYSTCHWCHVMERESFEDEEIAAYINQHYVPIKVDREERPDLDDVYMKAVQALTGRGGWPMTTLLTPQKVPFFGGTYFPPRDGVRGRRQGFLSILQEYKRKFEVDRSSLLQQAQKLSRYIARNNVRRPSAKLPKAEVITQAVQNLANRFDKVWGGFGRAPKFPTPPNLNLLMKYYQRIRDPEVLNMLIYTLRQIARGGIYDHLGGGFHRYATDRRWRIPHFEKMLYDNAQLASIYLQSSALVEDQSLKILFRQVGKATLDYLNREMLNPEYLYYSATDADSLAPNGQHPEEGLFFMWTPQELQRILSTQDYLIIKSVYQIEPQGELDGKNILYRQKTWQELSKASGLSYSQFQNSIQQAQSKLYKARLSRPAPLRDDKAITSWNALAISAMVHGARYLDKYYLKYAEQTAQSIYEHMLTNKGQLKRTFMQGQARHDGVLDDYVFLIQALLDLFEVSGKVKHLDKALLIQSYLDQHFWNTRQGAYFMTSDQAEKLITRDQPSYDGAEPSGNAVAVQNLMRLYVLTEKVQYFERAEKVFKVFANQLSRGRGMNQMTSALLDYHDQARQLVIIKPNLNIKKTTEEKDPLGAHSEIINSVFNGYWPNTALVVSSSKHPNKAELENLIPWLKNKVSLNNETTAYLCYEGICERPLTSASALLKRLSEVGSLYPNRSPEAVLLP